MSKEKLKKTQNQLVLEHLQAGKSISPLEALGVYGVYRLAARINELKGQGHVIHTEHRRDGNGRPFARYTLGVPGRDLDEAGVHEAASGGGFGQVVSDAASHQSLCA